MVDCISRRRMLLFSGTIIFVGSVLIVSAINFASFMVGLFVFGFGVVYAQMVAPLYIAEISPVSSVRGFLTSLPEAFVSVGALIGAVASYWLPKISAGSGWRFMVGIAAVSSMFLCIASFNTISETPYWLVLKNRLEDAKRILEKISASLEQSQLRLEGIRNSVGIHDENRHSRHMRNAKNKCANRFVALKELLIHPTPAVRHMFLTSLALHFLQPATGGYAVTQFSTNIFNQVGVRREIHKQFISYAFGLTGILSNLVSGVLVDKIGRRILLLYSVAGMGFSLTGFAIGLNIIRSHPEQTLTWALAICIVFSLSHTMFFSIGIGPVAWIYSSEVFPPRLRSIAIGIAVILNVFTGVIVIFSFEFSLRRGLSFSPGFNVAVIFFTFAGIAFSGWVVIFLFLPETKGVSLEEMETVFPGLGSFCSQKIKNSIHHMSHNG